VPYETKLWKLKTEAVYEVLWQEFDSAKIQEAREASYVEVLDFPGVPERRSFPPRLLIIVTGTACAVILSGVWILGVARWREIGAQHTGMVLARETFGTVRRRIAMSVVNRPEQKDQTGKSDRSAEERTKAGSG
jgi:hypothetical protein